MKKNLVTLVGEQPLPTLLSIRHLDPRDVLFVGTRDWHNVSQHLKALMERYASKFLVTGRYLSRTYKALTLAQGIHAVEMPGYTVHHGIPDQEQRRLIQTVHSVLAGR